MQYTVVYSMLFDNSVKNWGLRKPGLKKKAKLEHRFFSKAGLRKGFQEPVSKDTVSKKRVQMESFDR